LAQNTLGLRLFCSYSHQDEELRNEFAPYLAILEREGVITAWHDRKIQPGEEWAEKIDAEIQRSNLILLFISAHFIQSNYAFNIEMKKALEMHDSKRARVIPVLVRTTPLNGGLPFERLQMLPRDRAAVTSWPDRDQAWSAVTNELRALANSMIAAPERPLTSRRILLKCRSLPNEIICVFDNTALIGRSPACDIPVIQAPQGVGNQHARFHYDERKREFIIDDLDSRNGTYADGERVRTKTLRMGSRVNLGGELPFTFWRYDTAARACGTLLYSQGQKEIARYVLAPFRRAGIGTTIQDAIQVPLLAEGRAVGFLEVADEQLYYTRSSESGKERLRDGATIDAAVLKIDVRILE